MHPDARGEHRLARMHALLDELRYAVRSLKQSPVFVAVAVVTLALETSRSSTHAAPDSLLEAERLDRVETGSGASGNQREDQVKA